MLLRLSGRRAKALIGFKQVYVANVTLNPASASHSACLLNGGVLCTLCGVVSAAASVSEACRITSVSAPLSGCWAWAAGLCCWAACWAACC